MVGDTVTPKYLIRSHLGDIRACVFSYVGTPSDVNPDLIEQITTLIDTNATGFDGSYMFDATMIMAMAQTLSEKFKLPIKQAVGLIASDGAPIKYTDFPNIAELYKKHKKFSYYGYSGRVHFNSTGDNLTAYKKVYSIAKRPADTKKFCLVGK